MKKKVVGLVVAVVIAVAGSVAVWAHQLDQPCENCLKQAQGAGHPDCDNCAKMKAAGKPCPDGNCALHTMNNGSTPATHDCDNCPQMEKADPEPCCDKGAGKAGHDAHQ